MTLNAHSWEYYNQQPWNILRWVIYPSQEFHYNNIDKTMRPSYKKSEPIEENNEFYASLLLNQMGMTSYPSDEYINYVTQEDEFINNENLIDMINNTNKRTFHLFCWDKKIF